MRFSIMRPYLVAYLRRGGLPALICHAAFAVPGSLCKFTHVDAKTRGQSCVSTGYARENVKRGAHRTGTRPLRERMMECGTRHRAKRRKEKCPAPAASAKRPQPTKGRCRLRPPYASSSRTCSTCSGVACIAGSKILVETGRPLMFTATLMEEINRSHAS